MRKYYPGFTLFKFIGAMLIVLAHYSEFFREPVFNKYIFGFSHFFDIVVPCFYVLAGFLAYKGWTHSVSGKKYVNKYIRNIFYIYFGFYIIFIVAIKIPRYLSGQFNVHDLNSLFGAFFITGPFGPLWFIPPLLIGVYLCFRMEQAGRLRKLLIFLSIAFILVQLAYGSLQPLGKPWIEATGITGIRVYYLLKYLAIRYFGYSLIYILAGVLICKYEQRFTQINQLGYLALGLIGIEMILLQIFQRNYSNVPVMFSHITSTLWLFQVLLKARLHGVRRYHVFIQRFTLLMFLLHIPFIKLIEFLLGWQGSALRGHQLLTCLLLVNLLVAGICGLWQAFTRKTIVYQPIEEKGI